MMNTTPAYLGLEESVADLHQTEHAGAASSCSKPLCESFSDLAEMLNGDRQDIDRDTLELTLDVMGYMHHDSKDHDGAAWCCTDEICRNISEIRHNALLCVPGHHALVA